MNILTRQQLSEAIAIEAPRVPLTMPFFLAAELLKECRRQGLRSMKYGDTFEKVTVKIVVRRERAKCAVCGQEGALSMQGYLHSHRLPNGEWCKSLYPVKN